MLDPARVSVAVVGQGPAAERRLRQLRDGGAASVAAFADPPAPAQLEGVQVVYVAGLDSEAASEAARNAKAAGALVNVEDVGALCDFHVPGTVRRGDLLLTVGTGGKSPGLARALRRHLEQAFGPEWAGRLEELAAARRGWIDAGDDMQTVARRTDELIERNGWLA